MNAAGASERDDSSPTGGKPEAGVLQDGAASSQDVSSTQSQSRFETDGPRLHVCEEVVALTGETLAASSPAPRDFPVNDGDLKMRHSVAAGDPLVLAGSRRDSWRR